ncbi:hypothetical protein, partial [Burkholderia gladioli]|uniref:hypothetical protein n=1 Tax=Burkholderia gladioli TaxID=28095 RepID=UPI001ABAB615
MTFGERGVRGRVRIEQLLCKPRVPFRQPTYSMKKNIADPLGFSGPNLARVFRRFGPGGARQKRQLTGEFSRRQVFESR